MQPSSGPTSAQYNTNNGNARTTGQGGPANILFGNQPEAAKPKRPFYTVEFYQEYFNVDTAEVIKRVWASIIPNAYFFDVLGENADLYGPFWIATTVMAVAFVTNTIGKYIHDRSEQKEFTYDTTRLSITATVVYVYISAVPAFIWLMMRYFSFQPRFIEIVCLYGYGMTIWIPLMLIAMIQVEWITWILAGVGLFFSVVFVLRNYYPFFTRGRTNDGRNSPEPDSLAASAGLFLRTKQLSSGTIVVLFVLASQLAFALIYIFVFVKP